MELAKHIAEEEAYARAMGTRFVAGIPDRVVVAMPYRPDFGDNRVHGGAISSLVDIAATAAFWSGAEVEETSRGATVGFDIHFLSAAGPRDLTAEAVVRRRGGSICTGEVTVRDEDARDIACATVTYKLTT